MKLNYPPLNDTIPYYIIWSKLKDIGVPGIRIRFKANSSLYLD